MFEPCHYACSTRALPRAIAQNRGHVDTIVDARRYPYRQQNSQQTEVFKAGSRPAAFASARPVPPRTVRLALLADGVTAYMPGAVLAPAPTPEVAEVGKAPIFVDEQRRAQAVPAHRGCADFAAIGRFPHRCRCRARSPPGDHLGRPGRRRALQRPRCRGPAAPEGPAGASHPTTRHSSHRLRSPESLRSSDRWTDTPVRPGACGRREPRRLTRPPGIRGRGGTDRSSHLLSRLRIRNLGLGGQEVAPRRPGPSGRRIDPSRPP